jgi:hypothetical protein
MMNSGSGVSIDQDGSTKEIRKFLAQTFRDSVWRFLGFCLFGIAGVSYVGAGHPQESNETLEGRASTGRGACEAAVTQRSPVTKNKRHTTWETRCMSESYEAGEGTP